MIDLHVNRCRSLAQAPSAGADPVAAPIAWAHAALLNATYHSVKGLKIDPPLPT